MRWIVITLYYRSILYEILLIPGKYIVKLEIGSLDILKVIMSL